MFDYIIVGGGSAGCVLAARLSEDPGTSVCLLEAGPADTQRADPLPRRPGAAGADRRRPTGPSRPCRSPGLNGRRGYQPRGKVLGGSSSVNAMIYLRGQRADYDGWAAAGNPGWGWSDVLPYFKRSEHNERGADAWHGSGGPLNVMDLRSPNRFGPVFVEAARQAGHPVNADFNGASAGRRGPVPGHAQERRTLQRRQGLPDAEPRAQEPAGDHRRARARACCSTAAAPSGVELRQGGATRTLQARREVLLSAGALQSPQLLMLSGIGPGAQLQQHGIACVHDLPGVGRAPARPRRRGAGGRRAAA